LQLLLAATNTTKTATSLKDTNQICQSEQVRNVIINATDMFLAFTMMQQIMTALWSCDRKTNVAVKTKAVFRLVKNNPDSVRIPLKIIAVNANSIGKLSCQETFAILKNRCSPVLRDTIETS
jgi:hypothetical protein